MDRVSRKDVLKINISKTIRSAINEYEAVSMIYLEDWSLGNINILVINSTNNISRKVSL